MPDEIPPEAIAATPETVAVVKEHRKAERSRRLDLDVRGILALISLGGVFGISITQLVQGKGADVPQWASTLIGSVIGFYFGTKTTSKNGSDN